MEHITRCPACEIAFHVTDDQLQLAAGKVRCGACLSIFDARSHIESHLQDSQHGNADNSDDQRLIHDDMAPDTLAEDSDEPQPDTTATEPAMLPSPPSAPALDHKPAAQESVIPLGCDNDGSVIELGCDASSEQPLVTLPDSTVEESPFSTPARPRRRRPLTVAACVLALLLLPIQYVYFHFEQLAGDPQHRHWLVATCKLIGCQVPPLTATEQITRTGLIVTSHPQQPQALLVEAVLENSAAFAQPFPTLLLKFDDLQGATVAQRHFQPHEYLFGELDGASQFPPNRPVRIRLELADPGPDAINYQLLVTE